MSACRGQLDDSQRGTVCVFAKIPRPGFVKTRLAPRVGSARAAELAYAFLSDTLLGLRAFGQVDIVLALDACDAPNVEREQLLASLGGPPSSDQGRGDLGARMERVLSRALAAKPWAIALGADCPGMPLSKLSEAITSLQDARGPDCVFGPARDGGYFSFGARRVVSGMLDNVRWGGAFALADSEQAVARAGLSSARTSGWFDIDEASDLDELSALLRNHTLHAPATARLLSTIEAWEPRSHG